MFKAISAFICLFTTLISIASADIRQIDEGLLVNAVGDPVLKKAHEEDAPGCIATRYTFRDEIFAMKLEFKCDRINVAWNGSREPQNVSRSQYAAQLAQRAVIALTQGSGVEVERVMDGAIYKGRTFSNGLSLSGGCVMNTCLLTFK